MLSIFRQFLLGNCRGTAVGVTWGQVQRHLQDTGHIFWRPSLKEKREAASRSEGLDPPQGKKCLVAAGTTCVKWAPQTCDLRIIWIHITYNNYTNIYIWINNQQQRFKCFFHGSSVTVTGGSSCLRLRIYYRDVHLPELLVFRPMGQSSTEDATWTSGFFFQKRNFEKLEFFLYL